MWNPRILLTLLSFFALSQSTIISDTGCTCALTKGTLTTPNASSTIAAGCSFKADWTGQTREWCLTDQTYQTCGTFQPGFGYVDSCSLATFTDVSVQPAPQIEWDQTPYTYYTGQTFNITWNSQNILQDEWVRIQYVGAGGTRTLTTGSGVNITAKQYSVRLSDSTNGIATTPVPVSINLPSTASIATNSIQNITVLQSKLMNIIALDGNRTLGGGQNTVCDDRNLTVVWRGLGEAQFGTVSIVLRRQSGFSGTQTLASVNNIAVSGNTSINIVCPRTTSPSSSNAYAFQLTVNEPGGSDYTGNSPSFNVATAPTPTPSTTPTPTPSRTPTSSNTPTPSPSQTPSPTRTPTPSPSQSRTPTPSITSSSSATPSTTETARPSIDLAAIARNAASAVDTQTPAIAGALGGIGGILILLGGFKWYQQKLLTEKRKKKLAMSARWVHEANAVYGVHTSSDDLQQAPIQPSIVMYTVQNMPPKKQTKKAFTPVQGTSV